MRRREPVSDLAIATGRYFDRVAILESGLAPVGITVAPPRYRLGFELVANVGMLAPYELLGVVDREEFEARYRERLDRFGAEKILRVLEALAAGSEANGVCLLCFEDLTKPGEWCHRRIAAAWLEEQAGMKIPELEPGQRALIPGPSG
jgi:hypothetical protein